MPPALEALAQRLVASGRLRVHADAARNYVRHGTADSEEHFSRRELTDLALLPQTRRRLARHVAPAAGADGVEQLLGVLRAELRKTHPVSAEKEIRIARVVVQSAHDSVIQLLLASGTEVFVSYSHNVGELMPVHQWESEGLNSGMQATSDVGTAVYISCGGDPFFEGEHKTYTTDGFPALARMMVIGGQELGHFSDLLRRGGQVIGRYSLSANHVQMRAAPRVADGRLADMQRIEQLRVAYANVGLARLMRAETAVEFYHKRLKFSPPWFFHQLRRFVVWLWFAQRCKQLNVYLKLRTHPTMMHGKSIAMYLDDMAFNLAPEADVYRRPDPLEEEAIACIEALARVPQQMHKWGHAPVQFGWPKLYEVYYGTVIPGCIAASGQAPLNGKLTIIQYIKLKLRRVLRARPAYYPD